MATAKHFISDRETLVLDSLESITYVNPVVALDKQNQVLYRTDGKKDNVFIVSGGGSGHEPSFAGFVGDGFLDASVAGSVFASPSAQQVRNAISLYGKGREVLVIVMNYTGDILNFGLAIEKAKASGAKVELIVVGDDVGVGKEKGGKVGRRGIAGTVLVQKIAGALANTGASLEVVAKIGKLAAANVVSVGASLAHVHVPGSKASEATLAEDQVELGMGIHNEPGAGTAKLEINSLVDTMLAQLLDQNDKDRAFLHISSSDSVVLLINNLGGLSPLELGAILTVVVRALDKSYSIKPVRILCGTLMTSLNGQAFSISLLKAVDTGLGDGKSLIDLLDAPTQAVGWPAALPVKSWKSLYQKKSTPESITTESEIAHGQLRVDSALATKAIRSGCEWLVKAEPKITEYDTVLGDGDCGTGLKRGAEAVLKVLEREKNVSDVKRLVSLVTAAIEGSMDGTSGALYGIFFNALTAAIGAAQDSNEVTAKGWADALDSATKDLQTYTVARAGDRTMMDTLIPFVKEFKSSGDFSSAVKAAQKGSDSTKGLQPKLGRSVYVGGEQWKTTPDAGAYGLYELLAGLEEGLKN